MVEKMKIKQKNESLLCKALVQLVPDCSVPFLKQEQMCYVLVAVCVIRVNKTVLTLRMPLVDIKIMW